MQASVSGRPLQEGLGHEDAFWQAPTHTSLRCVT